ncbi:MAG: HPF/RaiA family ribosome-associated protein, partial [Bacteroidetes bacterium]|nr:HPF/RaiA family ribosome-associated protein [Bacteroidota bacterium]
HKSDDFYKSIDQAILKLEKQLAKYKSKVREKDKITVRKIKGKE